MPTGPAQAKEQGGCGGAGATGPAGSRGCGTAGAARPANGYECAAAATGAARPAGSDHARSPTVAAFLPSRPRPARAAIAVQQSAGSAVGAGPGGSCGAIANQPTTQ
ncbi:hypothetical protein [Mycobacterium persicum]|uniref:hypothetical protein n=1 Tax=Mycobacterium persicum TaxID=1487726 RepID=UPI003B967AAB